MHQLPPVEPCYQLIPKVLPMVGCLLPSCNQCISMESEIIIASGNNQVDRYKKTILNQHRTSHKFWYVCSHVLVGYGICCSATPCAIWLLERLPCLLSNPTSSGRAPASAISRWCSGCSRPICRMSMPCKPDVLALLSCSWHKFWWCLHSFTRKEQLVVISIKISYLQSHNHNPTEKCLLHRGDTSQSFFLKILNCMGIIGRPLTLPAELIDLTDLYCQKS